jgi:hypothetical protein
MTKLQDYKRIEQARERVIMRKHLIKRLKNKRKIKRVIKRSRVFKRKRARKYRVKKKEREKEGEAKNIESNYKDAAIEEKLKRKVDGVMPEMTLITLLPSSFFFFSFQGV